MPFWLKQNTNNGRYEAMYGSNTSQGPLVTFFSLNTLSSAVRTSLRASGPWQPKTE